LHNTIVLNYPNHWSLPTGLVANLVHYAQAAPHCHTAYWTGCNVSMSHSK